MASPLYLRAMAFLERFVPNRLMPIWKHPAGPQTVFFWSPVVKSGLVIAGLGDIARPVETVSVTQSFTLGLTGWIWARYSVVITPKIWALFVVNSIIGLTGVYQVQRGLRYQYQQSKKNQSTTESTIQLATQPQIQ